MTPPFSLGKLYKKNRENAEFFVLRRVAYFVKKRSKITISCEKGNKWKIAQGGVRREGFAALRVFFALMTVSEREACHPSRAVFEKERGFVLTKQAGGVILRVGWARRSRPQKKEKIK